MLFTLRQLHHLLAVADSGRISEAARRLHITQPALSASLQQLEANCGTDLFIRHKARGVSLTDSGRRLVVEARKLITQTVELEHYARNLGDSLEGGVELGCFTTLAPLWIPRMLSALRDHHPTLAVHVVEGDIDELHGAIIDGQIEVALSYDIDVPDALVATPLAKMKTYALLSSNHPLARRRKVSLTDLAADPMVLLDLPQSRDYFQSVFAAAGVTPNIAHRTTSFEMVRCMVANGLGYSVLNQRPAIGQSYDGGEVVMTALSDRLPTLHVVMLTLRNTRLTRRTQAVIDFCCDFYAAK
ncbi:MAG: LysR family transcriptional regulator [Pseudomonadota bacterium]